MQIILNKLKYDVSRRNISTKSFEYTLRYVFMQNNSGRITNRYILIRPREISVIKRL